MINGNYNNFLHNDLNNPPGQPPLRKLAPAIPGRVDFFVMPIFSIFYLQVLPAQGRIFDNTLGCRNDDEGVPDMIELPL